jgi:hypothetical protein
MGEAGLDPCVLHLKGRTLFIFSRGISYEHLPRIYAAVAVDSSVTLLLE